MISSLSVCLSRYHALFLALTFSLHITSLTCNRVSDPATENPSSPLDKFSLYLTLTRSFRSHSRSLIFLSLSLSHSFTYKPVTAASDLATEILSPSLDIFSSFVALAVSPAEREGERE